MPTFKKICITTVVTWGCLNVSAYAQLGIGTTTPHQSAALEMQSSTQGLLPPRLTTIERDNIQNPSEGLLIYNTTEKRLQYFTGSGWEGSTASGTTSPLISTLRKCVGSSCSTNSMESSNDQSIVFKGCPAFANVLGFPTGGSNQYPSPPVSPNDLNNQYNSFFIGADKQIYDMQGMFHSSKGDAGVETVSKLIGNLLPTSEITTPVYRLQTEVPNAKWKMLSLHQGGTTTASLLLALEEDGRLFTYSLSDERKLSSKGYRSPAFGYPAFQEKYSSTISNLHTVTEIEGFDSSNHKAIWKYFYPTSIAGKSIGFLALNKNDNLWYSWGGSVGSAPDHQQLAATSELILRTPLGNNNNDRILNSLTPKPATILNDILKRHSTDIVDPKNSLFSPIKALDNNKGILFLTQDGILNYYSANNGANYRIALNNNNKITQFTYQSSQDLTILGEDGKIYSLSQALPEPNHKDQNLLVSNLFNNHPNNSNIKQIISTTGNGNFIYAIDNNGDLLLFTDKNNPTSSFGDFINLSIEENKRILPKIDFIRAAHGSTQLNSKSIKPSFVIKALNTNATMHLKGNNDITNLEYASGAMPLNEYGDLIQDSDLLSTRLLYSCQGHSY